MNNKFVWILVAFALLVALLAVGLTRDPREIPSPLIGKSAPEFSLPQLGKDATFAPADLRGKVWLLNVWASWCVSCREEHAELVKLASRNLLPIVGLNYKEVRGDAGLDSSKLTPDEEKQLATGRAQQWLAERGDPYTLSVLDLDGRVGIDYGVYGVPETFLIDKAGVIRFKQIGVITPEALEQKLLPLIAELNQ
ncbi:MAG: DsbE family thiol:disulfide interchange protein [Zoogloeaceae bacterium]|jgi:cytochrome c biogenesis protein CcmG/thiol:disulfide interchange protein DsbE|nr:DsbE family thiol:disulfide interchange protein [Zoogloeaceae bacterium]